MTHSVPIIEVRKNLTRLPERFQKEPEPSALAVTRRGKPVLAVLPWDLYESIIETLEILSDERAMVALRRGIREAAANRSVPLEQAKRKLRL